MGPSKRQRRHLIRDMVSGCSTLVGLCSQTTYICGPESLLSSDLITQNPDQLHRFTIWNLLHLSTHPTIRLGGVEISVDRSRRWGKPNYRGSLVQSRALGALAENGRSYRHWSFWARLKSGCWVALLRMMDEEPARWISPSEKRYGNCRNSDPDSHT